MSNKSIQSKGQSDEVAAYFLSKRQGLPMIALMMSKSIDEVQLLINAEIRRRGEVVALQPSEFVTSPLSL